MSPETAQEKETTQINTKGLMYCAEDVIKHLNKSPPGRAGGGPSTLFSRLFVFKCLLHSPLQLITLCKVPSH